MWQCPKSCSFKLKGHIFNLHHRRVSTMLASWTNAGRHEHRNALQKLLSVFLQGKSQASLQVLVCQRKVRLVERIGQDFPCQVFGPTARDTSYFCSFLIFRCSGNSPNNSLILFGFFFFFLVFLILLAIDCPQEKAQTRSLH